jgi:hypothetical protein
MYLSNLYETKVADALEIRSISLYSGSMIPEQATAMERLDFHFNANTRMLRAVGNGRFLVKYIAEYPYATQNISYTAHQLFEGEDSVSLTLEHVPNPSTFTVTKGSKQSTIIKLKDGEYEISGDLGEGSLNTQSLELIINLSDTSTGDLVVAYTTKYPAIDCMTARIGNDFLLTWFTANICSALGAVKNTTAFDSMPLDITKDDLMMYGRQLQDRIEQYKAEKAQKALWTT